MKNKNNSNKAILYKLRPSSIYFTHSKIRKQFTGCGKTLQTTLSELINGNTHISKIPNIKVYYDSKGNYYSMNNRRLWVFKEMEAMNLLETIDVYLEPVPKNSNIEKNIYSMTAKPVLN